MASSSNNVKVSDDLAAALPGIAAAVSELKFSGEDDMGAEKDFGPVIEAVSISDERTKRYRAAKALKGLIPDDAQLVGCVCDASGDVQQIAAVTNKDGKLSATPVQTECMISFSTISPSQLVEYCFEDGAWHLAVVGKDAIESYKGSKFNFWKEMLESPTCEAQFRRLLQQGPINRMFDSAIFMPDGEKKDWQVQDNNGKVVNIPRPVSGLRIFSAEKNEYVELDPLMANAPSDNDKQVWWENFLKTLNDKHGATYVESLLSKANA